VVNSLAGLGGEDYLDPWVERSIAGSWSHGLGGEALGLDPPTLVVSARFARQRSAALVADPLDFRAVREIDDGTYGRLDVVLETGSPRVGLRTRTLLGLGHGEGRTWPAARLHLSWRSPPVPGDWSHVVELDAGRVSLDSPLQERFLLGGRETLPGHGYRSAGGDTFALLRARTGRSLWSHWITGHLLTAVGWAGDLGDSRDTSFPDLDDQSDELRVSLGAGVGLLWDVLRLDLARGVPDGEWEMILSVRPDFRSWL